MMAEPKGQFRDERLDILAGTRGDDSKRAVRLSEIPDLVANTAAGMIQKAIAAIPAIAAFTYTVAGLVPAPGGSGTTRFLREDGTWNAFPALPPTLGDGQSLQNVSGSRVPGTSYQNTTGRSIVVIVTIQSNSRVLQQSTNNVTWITAGAGAENGADNNSVCTIVPNGHYYRVTSGATIRSWAELR